MDYILYYSFIFAFILFLFGFLYQKSLEQRIFFFVGIALALVVAVSTFMFSAANVNRKRGIDHYDLFWLNLIFYVALLVTVLTLGTALIRKKFYPHGFLSIFAILQMIFYGLLLVYYAA